MRYEFIEPFINSTIKVLDNYLQTDITKGSCNLVRADQIREEIAVVVNLKGDSEGSILLNMPKETALNICNIMLGENFESLTPTGIDAIAELANMIAGKATTVLNNLGHDFRVLPPRVLVKLDSLDLSLVEIFQVPLFTEYGEITMNVSLNTN